MLFKKTLLLLAAISPIVYNELICLFGKQTRSIVEGQLVNV
jgi:hypothetical protein